MKPYSSVRIGEATIQFFDNQGLLHRLNGPALIRRHRATLKEYWVHGERYLRTVWIKLPEVKAYIKWIETNCPADIGEF